MTDLERMQKEMAENMKKLKREELIDEYAKNVVEKFTTNIIDYVFLAIEHDDSEMKEHRRQINKFDEKSINTAISKKVREIFNLENDGINENPKSSLILSFERLKIPKNNHQHQLIIKNRNSTQKLENNEGDASRRKPIKRKE